MTTSRHLLGSLILFAATGCTLERMGDSDVRLNRCERDADCGSGVCQSDGLESLCVATKADLANLYLELNLPTDAPVGPGSRLLAPASAFGISLQGSAERGFVQGVSLAIPEFLSTKATLSVVELPEECGALSGPKNLPATMRLYPVGHPIGISLAPYVGTFDAGFGGPKASVPSGTYDVVLEADTTSVPECELPPLVLPQRSFAHATELHVERTAVTTLRGSLDVPFDLACMSDPDACFRIELLENRRGRTLGDTAKLGAEGPLGHVGFRVRYFRDESEGTTLTPVLVVRPPRALRNQGMPDLYWKLGAIDPDGDEVVSLEVASLVAATSRFIPLEASVRTDTGDPAPANVLLMSRQLLGGAFGDNAVFQASVATDAEGSFAINVLPGKYDLVALPAAGSPYALTNETWTFADNDLGKGRTLELAPVSLLGGRVTTPAGDVVSDLAVQATPTVSEDVSLLEAVFSPGQSALLASLPRTASTQTDRDGVFDLPVDPGRLDLFLKPELASNLPWLVRRNLAVSATTPQQLDLGAMALSHPAVLVGNVVNTDGSPIANVTIRAWLGLDATDEKSRPSAVNIGESTSDEGGRYRLLLPPSVSQ